jgi:hypothetical protein
MRAREIHKQRSSDAGGEGGMEFRQGRFGLQRLGFLVAIHAGGKGAVRTGERPCDGPSSDHAGTRRGHASARGRPRPRSVGRRPWSTSRLAAAARAAPRPCGQSSPDPTGPRCLARRDHHQGARWGQPKVNANHCARLPGGRQPDSTRTDLRRYLVGGYRFAKLRLEVVEQPRAARCQGRALR